MEPRHRRFLVPTPRDHRPASDQGEALIRALIEQRWLPPSRSPEYARTAFERDEARLLWAVDALEKSGLRYPFIEAPVQGEAYAIGIEVSDDYLYRNSALVGPFENTACPCGAELAYPGPAEDPFGAGRRLRRVCPACRRAFDPGERTAEVRDTPTGEKMLLPGGLCYRFALVLETGTPRILRAHPELRSLAQKVLGVRLEDVGDLR